MVTKKIPTLFKRVFDDGAVYVTEEVTPECEWVLAGEGEATEKVDGTAVARIDGVWYKRFDAKGGRRIPAGSIACSAHADPVTGHWPHWTPAPFDSPSNRWLSAAVANTPWIGDEDGTFELVGRHIQGNPYGLDADFLERHGRIKLRDCPRTFDGIREYLRTHEIEGIVFKREDGAMCKIKRSDFGFRWPVSEERMGRKARLELLPQLRCRHDGGKLMDELVKSLRQCAEGSCAGCKNDLVQIGCRGLLQREAADAIEELRRSEAVALANCADEHNRRLALEQRYRWIPVKERLPNGKAERYLVAASLMSLGLRVSICYYADNLEEVDEYEFKDENHGGFYGYDDEYGYYERSGVKYWMPLPTPPTAEEGE